MRLYPTAAGDTVPDTEVEVVIVNAVVADVCSNETARCLRIRPPARGGPVEPAAAAATIPVAAASALLMTVGSTPPTPPPAAAPVLLLPVAVPLALLRKLFEREAPFSLLRLEDDRCRWPWREPARRLGRLAD